MGALVDGGVRHYDPEKLQGYLAHKKQPPPEDPTAGLCLGPYGGPIGGGQFLVSEVPL